MKVVGEADVLEVLVDNPHIVWKQTSKYSGITKNFLIITIARETQRLHIILEM